MHKWSETMKRRKRIGKFKFASLVKEAAKAALKRSVPLMVLAVFIFAVFLLIRAFAYRSDYFTLKVVETRSVFLDQGAVHALNDQLLRLYSGGNIFNMNLKAIARSLRRTYPDAREVSARIILPDKLLVTIKFTRPIAIVRGARTYAIDEDGMVLPSMGVLSLKGLPVIEGAAVRYDEKRNRQSSSQNLKCALELLREIKRSRFLTGYGVMSIDAGDLGGMVFCLSDGLEVRIGYENLRERLDSLEKTLKDPRIVVDRIKYIDVRFKDVVIGPK